MNSEQDQTVTGVYAKLGDAGLGNMLFPWSRAVVLAHELSVPLIEPIWWRPRLGARWRREKDLRTYHKELRRPAPKNAIMDQLVLRTRSLVDEEGKLLRRRRSSETVIITTGMKGYFEPISPYRELVKDRFDAVRRVRKSSSQAKPAIGMHIRLGDFSRPGINNHTPTTANTSAPIEWFADLSEHLQRLCPNQAILLFSDGSDRELTPVLRLSNVVRQESHGAIGDLWALASTKLVVGSASTFSAWAAFLGDTPLVLYPGQNRYLSGWDRVTEIGTGQPDSLRQVLNKSALV